MNTEMKPSFSTRVINPNSNPKPIYKLPHLKNCNHQQSQSIFYLISCHYRPVERVDNTAEKNTIAVAEEHNLGSHVHMTIENTHHRPTTKKKKKLSDRSTPPLNFWPPSSKNKSCTEEPNKFMFYESQCKIQENQNPDLKRNNFVLWTEKKTHLLIKYCRRCVQELKDELSGKQTENVFKKSKQMAATYDLFLQTRETKPTQRIDLSVKFLEYQSLVCRQLSHIP